MKVDKKNHIRRRIKDFFASKEEVLFVYLFGSMVDKEKFRDVDIAVYMKSTPDLISRGKLQAALDRILAGTVDVTILNELPAKNPAFAYEIVTKGVLLLNRDPDLHTTYKSKVYRYYFDTAYLRDQFEGAFRKRLTSGNFGKRNYE
ncbi:nucleotidyltransferase domain-containing protein [Halalkalibaculum sp. DA3122]|uniref:type VII toxin-antitoxin system MntA family adenylyltransferase antitoxin n=1 Tax=unclassified Halalkalibaculum TaxID=2964617 RepID=UPI003754EE0D